jgi:opacity protein-like surface antigen
MKKSTIFVIALIAISQFSQAQFTVGASAGIDINNVYIDGIPDQLTSPKNSLTTTRVGLFGSYALNEQSAIKVELNQVKKGFAMNQDIFDLGLNLPVEATINARLNYMEVPVMYKHTLSSNKFNFYVEGGPSLLYGTGGSVNPEVSFVFDFQLPGLDVDFADPAFNKTAFAANLGVGVEMPVSTNVSVFAQTRYSLGLTDLVEAAIIDIDTKTRSFNVGVGVSYAL